jgi:serine/threonine protein kinase
MLPRCVDDEILSEPPRDPRIMPSMRIVEDRKGTASRLGSYEVLHRFATGGMAELFLARSLGPEGFEKLVVIKKILPRLAGNERFVRLFLDEARLAASLEHPNITHVFDLGRVDADYFFTMEFVHGRDLRSVLHRSVNLAKPLPIEHAVHVARDVASALNYAHDKCGPDGNLMGIVHRDVSPSNVLISYEGTVKLLDFGVAKAATSTVKTRTGSLKGKVSYMSPEQARGATVDRRSDIFSAGIVMWEMVTSHRLFKGPNDLATIQLIINETPAVPSTLRPGCPPELDLIILRALAKDPDDRYQSASDLQSDLEELARENKLNTSSLALAAHLGVLFSGEIAAWRKARVGGVSLADHLLSTMTADDHMPSSEFSEEHDVENDAEKTERTTPPAPKRMPRGTNDEERSTIHRSSGQTPIPQLDHAVVAEPSIVIEDALIEEEKRNTPLPPELTFAAPVATVSEAGWHTPTTMASPVPPRPSHRGRWIAAAAAIVAVAVGLVIVKSSGGSSSQAPAAAAEVAPAESSSRTIELEPSHPSEVAKQPPAVVTAPPVVDPPAVQPRAEVAPVEAKPVVPKPEPAKVQPVEPPVEAKPVVAKPAPVAPKPIAVHKPGAPPAGHVAKPHADHPPAKPAAGKFDPDAALPPM